jgi:hypothetical protein
MGERPRVGMLVPNLFLLVPVEAAVREAGAIGERLGSAAALVSSTCRLVIADLDALGPDPVTAVTTLTAQGKAVLAFGPAAEDGRLAAVRRAGAVVLPRASFLARLPELLRLALG